MVSVFSSSWGFFFSVSGFFTLDIFGVLDWLPGLVEEEDWLMVKPLRPPVGEAASPIGGATSSPIGGLLL